MFPAMCYYEDLYIVLNGISNTFDKGLGVDKLLYYVLNISKMNNAMCYFCEYLISIHFRK